MAKKGKKPTWVVEKEREKRGAEPQTVWLFGHHAVRDALQNPNRDKLRLILTPNASAKLEDAVKASSTGAAYPSAAPHAAKPPLSYCWTV